ncbi:ASCH domain-containing protein [Fructilactobacillus vespulae]|uniref:ASCH domain-containing protein n=1 Tax=Fructilactobacillus vespulae TaxID=1249630 RepID=UPI0039B695A5
MTPNELFEQAQQAKLIPQTATIQDSYQFGAVPDELAQLVKEGIKTATTSAYDLYHVDEPLPQKGAYDVILNSQDQPVCIIKNDDVLMCPYLAVDAQHAYEEGEGDRTLKYWRKVHHDFFVNEYQSEGQVFDEQNAPMVLEKFHVVYPPLN